MLRLRSRTFVLAARLFVPAAGLAAQQWRYPLAPKSDGGDTYFGRSVADPYRPLEDLDAPATKAWVAAENALTFAYLDGLARVKFSDISWTRDGKGFYYARFLWLE